MKAAATQDEHVKKAKVWVKICLGILFSFDLQIYIVKLN